MERAVDEAYMRQALALAERGLFTTTPNPRVGCVLVRDGVVAGKGFHLRPGTLHAEAAALQDARAHGREIAGATAYVTLEPCAHTGRTPPCADALVAAKVARVVIATRDPHPLAAGGIAVLERAGIKVEAGMCEAEARDLNAGFFSVIERGRPWVRVKIAASLDGRTATEGGASQWITGAAARADGHAFRARACAVLTGIGTVRADDPALTVRAVPTERQPLRVVIDRYAETPADAKVLRGGALVVTAADVARDWPVGVERLVLPDASGRVDLHAMFRALAARGINEVHVEAGARLNGALFEAGLVDELLVYMAPSLIGDPARGMLSYASGITSLAQSVRLEVFAVDRVGEDIRVRARVLDGHAPRDQVEPSRGAAVTERA